MARFIETKIVCKCCGKEYTDKVLASVYLDGTRDMDTNPHEPAIYEKVLICPHCGYATDKVKAQPGQAVKGLVEVDARYHAIFMDPTMDQAKKKMLLAARVCEAMGDEQSAGMYYLRAAWRTRELAQDEGETSEYLCAALEHLERYLMENENIDCALIYTDVLRQLGLFAEAENTALGLEPLVEDAYKKKVLAYERKLIADKDTEPRSQKGVEA